MKTCPGCGNDYEYLGAHWYHNPGHRVNFSDEQADVLKGLLMSDGSIDYSKGNARYHVKMTNKKYLEYIDDLLGVVSTGVELDKNSFEAAKAKRESGFRPNADEENYSSIYSLRTIKHPFFNKFAEWYKSGEKVWPKKIDLTPNVLKHWYVGDGSLKRTHNMVSIAMYNERDNISKVENYFLRKDLPAPDRWYTYDRRCRATWNVDGSERLLDYMGSPPPGFEYKWV